MFVGIKLEHEFKTVNTFLCIIFKTIHYLRDKFQIQCKVEDKMKYITIMFSNKWH